MKFSCEFVWSKVLKQVPHAHQASMSLPEALKRAAVAVFMKENDYPKIQVPEYDKYVIHESIKELNEKGFLEFGEINQDWG